MPYATPNLTRHQLIVHLCLEASRIMEDTSAELATTLPGGSVPVELRLDLLRQASADITAYSAAADALHLRETSIDQAD